MQRDRYEKRLYRKSPGRQYGYDYDPLHSQGLNGNGQPGRSGVSIQSEPLNAREGTSSQTGRHTSGLLGPRPDPRRTRQLIRQNIIANKSKSGLLDDTGQLDPELRGHHASPEEDQGMYDDQVDSTLYAYRRPRSVQLPPEMQGDY